MNSRMSCNIMESLSPRVISHYVEAAYRGCERNIRDDLTLKEQKILDRIKIFMNITKTKHTEVFAPGSYASFLEGVLRDYDAITIVCTCNYRSWDKVLSPETYLNLFMKGRGTIAVLKREERPLNKPPGKIDRIRCLLTFNDDIKVTIDIGKIATSFAGGLRESIQKIFGNINQSAWKVALIHDRQVLFRWEHIKDETSYFKSRWINYGSPFTLTWHSAKKLNII